MQVQVTSVIQIPSIIEVAQGVTFVATLCHWPLPPSFLSFPPVFIYIAYFFHSFCGSLSNISWLFAMFLQLSNQNSFTEYFHVHSFCFYIFFFLQNTLIYICFILVHFIYDVCSENCKNQKWLTNFTKYMHLCSQHEHQGKEHFLYPRNPLMPLPNSR